MISNICEIKDCERKSEYITTTDSKMIEICKEHYNEKYKN